MAVNAEKTMESVALKPVRESFASKSVIAVLGEGHNDDGTLTRDSKINIERAVGLFKKGKADKIIMSTYWHFNRPNIPNKTEAQAMMDYAVELGVPKEAMILEKRSLDTMGNIFFSKKIIETMSEVKIVYLVFADYHKKRSEYLSQVIFGGEYDAQYHVIVGDKYYVQLIESNSKHESEWYKKKDDAEEFGLARFKRVFQNVQRGNDAEFQKVFETFPWYAKDFDAVPKEMWKELEYLGDPVQLWKNIQRNKAHLEEIKRD